MLSKLIEIEDTKQQSQYLSQLIESGIKNSRQYVNQLNEQLIQKLKKIPKKQNFSQWLQLCFILLSVQQCFQYASIPTKSDSPLISLIDSLGQLDLPEKHQKIQSLSIKYPNLELSLPLLAFLAKHCTRVTFDELPRILPVFIKLASSIVEKYLQLKNQPAKSAEDRIQDDKIMVECTEKWVAQNFGAFFGGLMEISGEVKGEKDEKQMKKHQNVKEYVLMALCDVAGALIQIDRSNTIQKENIDNILEKSLLKYCRKNYTYNELYYTFCRHLKMKKYNNPIRKIQIPEIYSDYSVRTVGLNTQGYAYFLTQHLTQSLLLTCTNQHLLKLLIPTVSQMLSRPYELKIRLIYFLQKISTILCQSLSPKKIMIKTGFQFNYPIQLLFFDFFHFQKQRYESLVSRFQFENEEVFVNSLILFQEVHLDNLAIAKRKFVLKSLEKYACYSRKDFVILGRINFKEEKVKSQSLILQILDHLKQKFPKQSKQLAIKWKSQSENIADQSIKQKLETFTK